MKLKALFLAGLFLASTPIFADENHHVYPQPDGTQSDSTKKSLKWPGYCEIEVINDSFSTVRVYGIFDDGVMLRSFNIYTFEYPHYISLFYYGYCHAGMDLYVETWSGYRVYGGYTPTNTTLHIVPYMTKEQPKVELIQKHKTQE